MWSLTDDSCCVLAATTASYFFMWSLTDDSCCVLAATTASYFFMWSLTDDSCCVLATTTASYFRETWSSSESSVFTEMGQPLKDSMMTSLEYPHRMHLGCSSQRLLRSTIIIYAWLFINCYVFMSWCCLL